MDTMGNISWVPDAKAETLLHIERYAQKTQGSVDSDAVHQEVRVAIMQADALRARVEAHEAAGGSVGVPPGTAAEAAAGGGTGGEDEEGWLALFEQRTRPVDLHAVTEVPEVKVWEIVGQVYATLAWSETPYGRTLSGYLQPRVSELIARVGRILPHTKLHSATLSDVVSSSISQAVRIASTASFEQASQELCGRIRSGGEEAERLAVRIGTAFEEGAADTAEQAVKERLACVERLLDLHACTYDALAQHREQFVGGGRHETEQVWSAAVHEAERLASLNTLMVSRLDADARALNEQMTAMNVRRDTEVRRHAAWLEECNVELRSLQVKSDAAWDEIRTQEGRLKTYAEERMSLVRERLRRNEQEHVRAQEKRRADVVYASRANVLKLNKGYAGSAGECYAICRTIADEVKAKLQKLTHFVCEEVDALSREKDGEYDALFRDYYTQLSDFVYRKQALASSLQFEADTDVSDDPNSPEALEKTDAQRARIAALLDEAHAYGLTARSAMHLYDKLVGNRLRAADPAFVSPQTDADAAIASKRAKLKMLAAEQAAQAAAAAEEEEEKVKVEAAVAQQAAEATLAPGSGNGGDGDSAGGGEWRPRSEGGGGGAHTHSSPTSAAEEEGPGSEEW